MQHTHAEEIINVIKSSDKVKGCNPSRIRHTRRVNMKFSIYKNKVVKWI